MSETTPRITAPYLENFTHQIVRILGKVTQLRGDNATVDAGGQISIRLSRVNTYLFTLNDASFWPINYYHTDYMGFWNYRILISR